jgi:hypothetical protein
MCRKGAVWKTFVAEWMVNRLPFSAKTRWLGEEPFVQNPREEPFVQNPRGEPSRTTSRGEPLRGVPRSAATNLARQPWTRDEAARGLRFPGLLGLRLWRPFGGVRRGLGCLSRRVCRSLGPRGRCLPIVLVEATVLVLATRAAVAGLVAPRARTGLSSHQRSVPYDDSRLCGGGVSISHPYDRQSR